MGGSSEVERRRREHPELEKFFKDDRLEGFFVKNLETVQGDERDVIIFSIGYGKDQQGRMSMNFGPLNKQGGERRLNVAVTRAREKVVLVSSIRASDIDLRGTQAAGVLNLHHYLNYAERGEKALTISHPQGLGETESPLEDEVAAAIRSLGYDVVTQVGCSGYRVDMAVVDPALPGQFLLGVECDGATYHSAATARDRDRLRQQVLESLGWRIHRIWSPDWVTKYDAEIARLKSAIEKAREYSTADDADSPTELEPQIPEVERVQIPQTKNDDYLPGTISYSIFTVTAPRWLGEFHLPEQRAQQCELLIKIVNKEGPIHIELATRRLLTIWGISRSGPRILSAVEEAIRICKQRKQLITKGKFLWPIELIDIPVRVPSGYSGESLRTIEHIAPEEIQEAMLLLLHHAAGMSTDSLTTETVKLFGFSRTSNKIKERLLAQIKALQSKGSMTKNGDSLALC